MKCQAAIFVMLIWRHLRRRVTLIIPVDEKIIISDKFIRKARFKNWPLVCETFFLKACSDE